MDGTNGTGWECYRMQRMIAYEKEKELTIVDDVESKEFNHREGERSLLENDEWFSGVEDVEYVSSCSDDSSSQDEISSLSESESEVEDVGEEEEKEKEEEEEDR